MKKKKTILDLVNILEEPELGENAVEELKKFGPICVPEVKKDRI